MTEQNKAPEAIDIAAGHIIRQRRRQISMSQEALAEACGVSFQQIQKYENGSNRVSISRLYQIANALGCDVESLLPDAGEAQLARQAASDPASEWLMGRQAFDLAMAVTRLPDDVARQLVDGLIRAARSISMVIPPGQKTEVQTTFDVERRNGDEASR